MIPPRHFQTIYFGRASTLGNLVKKPRRNALLAVGRVPKEDKALGPKCFEGAKPIDRARSFMAVI
ncbi:unnamed protein product [Penicillium camemberti]|uniref:Str. FM013 n=1 Tax=Penicillium camemberti (strain FM 013) TaxID=1429867 RepID=A0A0G4PIZ9_PENC3|nr:unnamed protein product [Penicillium camemberti]